MATLLDGKKVASDIKESLKREVAELKKLHGRAPVLASVCAGDCSASQVYTKAQARCAEELGIEYRAVGLKKGARFDDVAAELKKLNADLSVHGIIVQAPLPSGVRMDEVLGLISPQKDAEGMHPENLGRLLLGQDKVAPCTAEACLELLRTYNIKLYGREVVIVGHSEIIGKPLSLMLLKEFATTTVCHVATSEAGKLIDHVRRAEILIVAVGKPHFIKGEWIKAGAVVIDVGINRAGDAIVGDVEFEAAEKVASCITPVPGGVGPLTVAMLMRNVVHLAKDNLKN